MVYSGRFLDLTYRRPDRRYQVVVSWFNSSTDQRASSKFGEDHPLCSNANVCFPIKISLLKIGRRSSPLRIGDNLFYALPST